MSMKYEYLEEMKNDFIKALQKEVANAKNEDDFSDLEDIAEDILNCLPRELVQCDYITRQTIASYVDGDTEDSSLINNAMRVVWESDIIHLEDNLMAGRLQDCMDKFNDMEEI